MRRAIVVFSVLIAGCAAGKDYERPTVTVPAVFAADVPRDVGTPVTITTAEPIDAWWTSFGDDQLSDLTDRAVKNNLDVVVAVERVNQSRGQRKVALADFYPQLNMSGRFTHAKNSTNGFTGASSLTGVTGGGSPNPTQGTTGASTNSIIGLSPTPYNLWQAGFDANWEIDVFGRIRRSTEAAKADVETQEENRNGVLLSVTADVVRNYVELRTYQREIQIARENYEVQQRSVAIARTRFQAGLTTELDVAQAEQQAADTAASIPPLVSAVRMRVHEIAVLHGDDPLALNNELDPTKPIPTGPDNVPVGVPAEMLKRRPDIRAAERSIAAATARTGANKALLYPKLMLNGTLGLLSRETGNFFDENSAFYNFGPVITWPVFDGGRIRGNIQVQSAVEGQARAQFKSTVLQALRDVNDALVALGNERTRRQNLALSVEASEKALKISNELYTQGLTTFLNVIEAQSTVLAAQNALATSDQQIALDLVQLYQSLGGGWETKLQVKADARD